MDFHKRQFDQKRSPVDCGLRGYFMPRMSGAEGQSRTDTELPCRFLGLVRIVLIDAIRRGLVQPPKYLPASVRA